MDEIRKTAVTCIEDSMDGATARSSMPCSPSSHVYAPVIELRDGNTIPAIGFGCYQTTSTLESVQKALQVGYRYIDSARVYKNEDAVGQAVREAIQQGIPRSDIFIVSKVNARSHSLKETPKAIRQSLNRSGLDYIDLYLLHDAISGKERRLQAYSCLLAASNAGQIRSVGVSNWSVKHLEELREEGYEMPVVNQIELHPWCQQKDIVEYCKGHDIVIQAYCPLVRGQRLNDPVLQRIASELHQSPAQILLRWSVQHGYIPIPKSDTPARIGQNYNIWGFKISEENMDMLDALDLGAAGACSWNPVDCA